MTVVSGIERPRRRAAVHGERVVRVAGDPEKMPVVLEAATGRAPPRTEPVTHDTDVVRRGVPDERDARRCTRSSPRRPLMPIGACVSAGHAARGADYGCATGALPLRVDGVDLEGVGLAARGSPRAERRSRQVSCRRTSCTRTLTLSVDGPHISGTRWSSPRSGSVDSSAGTAALVSPGVGAGAVGVAVGVGVGVRVGVGVGVGVGDGLRSSQRFGVPTSRSPKTALVHDRRWRRAVRCTSSP